MKRIVIALLAFALFMTGANAQGTGKNTLEDEQPLHRMDSLQLDSVYKYWDNFVTEHPKDEKAWRNLIDVEHAMVGQRSFIFRIGKQREQLRKQLNVVPRMAKAIPGTYTYYYSYVYEQERVSSAYVDSAVSVLPKDVPAEDYDLWVNYLFLRKDSLPLIKVLTLYYESGQYPASALQYDYNELQGMEKGGVYLGETRDNIIGKLILQHVLGLHKDKILCTVGTYVKRMFESIGIPFSDEIIKSFNSLQQEEKQTAVLRYTFEQSKRPIYLSACARFVSKMPDDLKACLYNEGLTMHYSAKPYNNMAVKRRNVEQRYLMDYLVLQFHPEVKSYDPAKSASSLAFNYMVLLYDLMPYYKKHNAEQYAKLNRILTGIMKPLRGRGWGFASGKSYNISFSEDGGPHYEFAEGSYYRGDPNEDPETERQKRQELFEKTKRVLIKTEPIE